MSDDELARQINERRQLRESGEVPPEPGRAAQAPGPVPVRITNAFSVGFYAFWGAFVASLFVWVLALIVLGACGSMLAGLRSG